MRIILSASRHGWSVLLVPVIMVSVMCLIVALLVLSSCHMQNDDTSETSPTQPVTVGVILTGTAEEYGWGDIVAGGAGYAEAHIDNHRVIVFANLNPVDNSAITLEQVAMDMIKRGANVLFVSSAHAAGAETSQINDAYPNTTFIMNLAHREDVQNMLPALDRLDHSAADSAPVIQDEPAGESESPSKTAAEKSSDDRIVIAILVGIVVVGVALRAWWRNTRFLSGDGKRKRRRSLSRNFGVHTKAMRIQDAAERRQTNFAALGKPLPLVHKFSTYVVGYKLYDVSYSIELPEGDFLGECGVNIAETMNPYERDKAVALEVWMFDKDDIRTVSAVLMSEHAFGDFTLRGKLKAKGELILVEPDAVVELETKTLHLRARVLDMGYGFSDTQPTRSFFKHVVIELAIWQR